MGCSPCGCKESDMTERLHFHFLSNSPAEGLSEVQLRETVLTEGPNEWGPLLPEAQESPLEQRGPRESPPPARLRFAHARLAVPSSTPPAYAEGRYKTTLGWNSYFL